MDSVLSLGNTGNDGSLKALLRKSGRVLMEPSRFFRVEFPAMDTTSLLAFGIGNAWAASIAAFFVQTLNTLLLSQLLDRWMRRLIASEEGFSVWGLSANGFLLTSGVTLLGPFLYLLQAVLGGFGLFLFARLLIEDLPGAPEPVTYTASLRIRAATLVAEWYTLIPVFGGLLAFVAHLVLAVTGVRERFGVSTRRATAVVLAPYVLMLVAVLVLGALAMVAISQLPLQELMDLDPSDLGL